MNKNDLTEELKKLIENLETQPASKGEIESTIAKINIIQSEISALNQIENNAQLKKIIRNNKRTSFMTLLLSAIMLILALVSLFNNTKDIKPIYKSEMNKILEFEKQIEKHLDSLQHYVIAQMKKDSL